MAAGFTNEAGLGATTLFLRNLTGLWLLEQAIRQWQDQGKSVTISSLVNDAATVGPTSSLRRQLSELVSSEDVLGTVRMQCTSTDMTPPETPAEVTRCILQSLALTYRRTIDLCEQLTAEPVEVHMIGGGSLNPLLRRLTTDACGRPLRAARSRQRRSAAWLLKLLRSEYRMKPSAGSVAAKLRRRTAYAFNDQPYDASGSNWIASSPLPGALHDRGTRPDGSGTAVPDSVSPRADLPSWRKATHRSESPKINSPSRRRTVVAPRLGSGLRRGQFETAVRHRRRFRSR